MLPQSSRLTLTRARGRWQLAMHVGKMRNRDRKVGPQFTRPPVRTAQVRILPMPLELTNPRIVDL